MLAAAAPGGRARGAGGRGHRRGPAAGGRRGGAGGAGRRGRRGDGQPRRAGCGRRAGGWRRARRQPDPAAADQAGPEALAWALCGKSRSSAAVPIRPGGRDLRAARRGAAPGRLRRFANDCLEVQLQSNCRERDVFLIQPLSAPVQEHLVELLLMLDAARGASAARVTAVIPHYAYARSDKKTMPRVSIGGRLVADLLVTAGASRVLTMTLHAPQVHGFFSVPVDHLHALPRDRRPLPRPGPGRRGRGLAGPGQRQVGRRCWPGCWACRSRQAPRSGTATPA